MRFTQILTILLVAAAASAQTPADPIQFLAQVARHQGPAATPTRTPLSNGVLTGHRHVVVPASFVNGMPREELRVYLQSNRLHNSTDVRTVEEMFIHPDFVVTNPDANNIAVLRLSYSELDNDEIEPRWLGTLTAVACTIYGFEAWLPELRSAAVNVTSAGCRAGNPFCATFSVTETSCSGFAGSPVVCANQAYVSGIANVDSSCTLQEGVVVGTVTFLSIEPFADWIRYVSSARVTAQISLLLMTLGVMAGKFLL